MQAQRVNKEKTGMTMASHTGGAMPSLCADVDASAQGQRDAAAAADAKKVGRAQAQLPHDTCCTAATMKMKNI